MPPRKRAEPGKRAASETAPREGQFIQPVGPSTAKSSPLRRDSRPRHAAPDDTDPAPKTPRKAAAKKAAPKSSPPAPKSSPPAPGGGHVKRAAVHARLIEREGRAYADRQAYKATHGKPSVTGRTVAGAAAGAAAGTVFGPAGTAVGGALGGAGGAIGGARAKKQYKLATRSSGTARRIIVTEFAICIVIAALSPMTDAKKSEPPGAWMKRMTAIMGLFFLLGLISAAGTGAAKAAAGFGGVVTVALAVSERDLFTKLSTVFGSKDNKPAAGTGPPGEPGKTPVRYTPPKTPHRYTGAR